VRGATWFSSPRLEIKNAAQPVGICLQRNARGIAAEQETTLENELESVWFAGESSALITKTKRIADLKNVKKREES
jgi:hypothetical protein